jgi:CRISPR-associated protein Cas5t
MQLLRVGISGWTASFRYPAFISGFQPTLPVPPLSTICGLLSAAKGAYVQLADTGVGYVFLSQGKGVDLETIYELEDSPLRAKSNIVRREMLVEPRLFLYVTDLSLAEFFDRPRYPLLLGRSTELAMVAEKPQVIEFEERQGIRVGGTLFPFPMEGIYGPVQALPTHFSDTLPRRAMGTRPFCIVDHFIRYDRQPLPYDAEHDWGVFMHHG